MRLADVIGWRALDLARPGRFRVVWMLLSEEGECDRIDGGECRRVYAEWLAAGQPIGIARFIMERANVGQGGPPTQA